MDTSQVRFHRAMTGTPENTKYFKMPFSFSLSSFLFFPKEADRFILYSRPGPQSCGICHGLGSHWPYSGVSGVRLSQHSSGKRAQGPKASSCSGKSSAARTESCPCLYSLQCYSLKHHSVSTCFYFCSPHLVLKSFFPGRVYILWFLKIT